MRRRIPLLAALAALAPAAAAAAQAPEPQPEAQPAAQPAPGPAAAGLRIAFVSGVFDGGKGRRVAPAGGVVRVRAISSEFVAGQQFVFRLFIDGRKAAEATETLRAAAGGSPAPMFARLKVPRSGKALVRVSHEATPELAAVSETRSFTAASADVGAGARGPLISFVQRQLDRLRFAVPRSGVLDGGTGRALMAYRKLNGMPRNERLSRTIVTRLAAGRGGFKVRRKELGRHVEASLSKQVLALINPGGKVHRVYQTSSGAPATPTVLGTFRFYMKTPGTNAKGMVHSSYFIRGYAIHGFVPVPPYPASHGCLRVPVANARTIFDWIRLGDRIAVYR